MNGYDYSWITEGILVAAWSLFAVLAVLFHILSLAELNRSRRVTQ